MIRVSNTVKYIILCSVILILIVSSILIGLTIKKNSYDTHLELSKLTPEATQSTDSTEEIHSIFQGVEDYNKKYPTAESYADAVIVTQSGSMQEGFVNAQIPKMKEFKLVSSMTDGFLMVSEGKADACACAIENAQLYADANGGLAIANGFRFVIDESTQGTRIGIPLGEEELTEFVNQCIDELLAEGKTNAWYEEYSEYARSLGIE